MKFPERLKLIREAFSVSQVKLAEDIGVKQYYVAKWESGKYDPNPEIKKKIADYFQISPLWLSGENVRAFSGMIFIPNHFLLPSKRLDLSVQNKISSFICADGAQPIIIVLNRDNKPYGMIVFKRGNELLLFLPYISFLDSIDRYGLQGEIYSSLRPCYEYDDEYVATGEKIVNLPVDVLYKINPNTPIEEIESILKISIPKQLKEIHREFFIPDVKKYEWNFTAHIRVGSFKKINESEAKRLLSKIESRFNKEQEDEKIFILEVKRKS